LSTPTAVNPLETSRQISRWRERQEIEGFGLTDLRNQDDGTDTAADQARFEKERKTRKWTECLTSPQGPGIKESLPGSGYVNDGMADTRRDSGLTIGQSA